MDGRDRERETVKKRKVGQKEMRRRGRRRGKEGGREGNKEKTPRFLA